MELIIAGNAIYNCSDLYINNCDVDSPDYFAIDNHDGYVEIYNNSDISSYSYTCFRNTGYGYAIANIYNSTIHSNDEEAIRNFQEMNIYDSTIYTKKSVALYSGGSYSDLYIDNSTVYSTRSYGMDIHHRCRL